uniref:Uncharacterized protein n=1 Tax=Siphoviridae sp. ctCIv11 TaxID=2827806 RepID=A0A8S5S220_9CAUD|nr:MAG TPA: hypothetical protein [Siphoviridae sp. ctCIv11]DAO12239.1 MAG TPA: hypothetical protein [Bacteriophage sp.]
MSKIKLNYYDKRAGLISCSFNIITTLLFYSTQNKRPVIRQVFYSPILFLNINTSICSFLS